MKALIAIALAVVLVGCGDDEETAVKPMQANDSFAQRIASACPSGIKAVSVYGDDYYNSVGVVVVCNDGKVFIIEKE